MNERIQELMKEAQVIYDYAPFYGDMDRDPKPLYKLDPEKFAELIVQECMTICAEREEDCRTRIKDDGKAAVAYMCRAYIKKHFGVE